MRRPGSVVEMRAYFRQLETAYEKRIVVRVLTRDHDLLTELTPRVIDGQVNVDTTQTPSRKLHMTLVDPSRSLGFEGDGLGDLPLHQRRMLQLGYSVRVPSLQRWITVWVFTGPIATLTRRGAEVELTADGKEALAMGTAWIHRTYKKGRKKTDVIRAILASTGETRFDIPDLPGKLPKTVHLRRLDKPWEVADKIARSMNRQLFYTGGGTLVLRKRPAKPVLTIDGGGDQVPASGLSILVSEPQVGRPSEFRNIWEVLGRKPRGAKKRVGDVVQLPKSHPLSAHNPQMMRNGKPAYRGDREVNDAFRTKKDCRERAVEKRDNQVRVTNEFACEIAPLPIIDDDDLLRFRTPRDLWIVRAKQFAFPLRTEGDPGTPMQIGSTKRTMAAPPRKRAKAVQANRRRVA